jgi:hypothetical protein
MEPQMSEDKKPKSKWFLGLSDKISTLPGGWDLSSLLAPKSSETKQGADKVRRPSQKENPDLEAKKRTDWQLDPHFDKDDDPSRRDLSAF